MADIMKMLQDEVFLHQFQETRPQETLSILNLITYEAS